ncbi:hypothetical protein ACFLUU_02285 [Chloroflexota bacterium]
MTSISIEQMMSYPGLPQYYRLISLVYSMKPTRATFEPVMDPDIDYDSSLVPVLFNEKNLVIAAC